MRFLIDTGATVSVINPGLCQTKFLQPLDKPFHIKTMTGNREIIQKATIPKELFNFPISQKEVIFYITPFHETLDGLIASDILISNNVDICFSEKCIHINGQIVPLYFHPDEEPSDEINSCIIEPQPELYSFTNFEKDLRFDHLKPFEIQEIKTLTQEFKDIFYKDGDDLTFTNDVKHSLQTNNPQPIYTKIYRYPHALKEEVDKQIKEMLENGIIRHSNSPYNAPIWVVPKKLDASERKKWRMVIDYRKLNDATKEDKYPIPNIDDLLSKLGKCNYYSVLDLAKGFHQIEIDPSDIEKTAFSTSDGYYEFIRMPFGLKNAPATFQRMMNNVLRNEIGKVCYVYMDDIVIFSVSL